MFNAAVIGTGVGLKHLEAINNYKSIKVKIICEKNIKKFSFLKKKYPNIKITNKDSDIYNDPNIKLVSIASYDNYHYKQILKCIKSKKHIICEKPFCLSENELKNIYKLLKKNKKIKFLSNLVLRVNSLFKNIKKITKSNNVYYVEADYIWGRKKKLFGWRSKIKNYSGTLGAGIHVIDLINWILNKKPLSVTAFGNNKSTKKSLYKKKSFIIYIFKFPGNILAKVTANLSAVYNHIHEIKIFEEKKTIVHNYDSANFYSQANKKIVKKKIKGAYPDKVNRKKLIHNFIDQLINKDTKAIITFKDQVDLMTICFHADKALQKNKEIKIKYL